MTKSPIQPTLYRPISCRSGIFILSQGIIVCLKKLTTIIPASNMCEKDKLYMNLMRIFVILKEKNSSGQIAFLQYGKLCARYRPTIDNL
jgi:hypothetical protein